MTTDVNGAAVVQVRTPTLPPATHTNAWVLGEGDALTVVDPASPYEDERARLFAELRAAIADGREVRRLFLTHHHQDHVSGAVDLRDRLGAAGHAVPIAAHPVTAELVRGSIAVDELVHDGDVLDGTLVAHHTPGHAPGHLVLHHQLHGWVVAGDMVAGIGTIVLDPDEGDLQQYLDSLERVRALAPTALLPAHGPVLPHADAVISFYVAHRHQRTDQIRVAVERLGRCTPIEIAPVVYPELPEPMRLVAAAQITTHLRWMSDHGLVDRDSAGRWASVAG